jgi:hypothetical protein
MDYDILKENAICKNPSNAPLRMAERRSYSPLVSSDPVLKMKNVKALNKAKIVVEKDIFDFSNGAKKKEPKEKKENKDKRFNLLESKDKKKPKMRNTRGGNY